MLIVFEIMSVQLYLLDSNKIVFFRSSKFAAVADRRQLVDYTQKANKQHVVLIPVIHGNKRLKFPFSLHSLTTVNTLRHGYDTWAVYTHVCCLKTCKSLAIVFQSFLAFPFAKFPVQISGWEEGFKQLHRRNLMLDSK